VTAAVKSELMLFVACVSGINLAAGLLDETPLVPVVVRYDPAVRGPNVAHGSAAS
jgi:hypothetical protein